ncbi:MOSC domain-containing protein [Mesobacillus thioparans]|uniref:MOSC domain-containing protein n=1 Tax=Mesobacillus thioparans TaxID=370439 RepID=UPI0039F126EF
MGKILYLHIGKPELKNWIGKTEESAIGKKSVKEAFLAMGSFEGDGVAATEFHGGPDRAVCFYPAEHYRQWSSEFNKSIEVPTFGENISAHGMKESDVYIGDIYRLGEATVQVSQGRIPCSKISKNNQIDLLLKKVVQTGYTGYFFRVLEEGLVNEEAEIILLDRVQEDFSILEANDILFHRRNDVAAIESLIGTEGLAEAWKQELNKLLKQKN